MPAAARGRPNSNRGRPAGTPDHGGYGRVAAAFRRAIDADPRVLDKLAASTLQKALEGDNVATAFVRDTLDGKPVQRSDALITTNTENVEAMTDSEIAAYIAALKAKIEAEDKDATEH